MTRSSPSRTDDALTDRRLSISAPTSSPADEPIAVRVSGVPPGERVHLEASTTGPDGVEWRSEAAFRADDGVVDLTECAPASGDYDVVAPMGWLWSMHATADQPVLALMDPTPREFRLRATAGERVAERTITRRPAPEGVVRRDVAADGVVGTVFEPAGEGPHPGVVALHGSGGYPLTYEAALLARHGFAALSLRYFGPGDPIPDENERVPLPYFERAGTWFRNREYVRDAPPGVLGRSWGALAALLVAARQDWVGAVVSYAGSGVVWDTPGGAPAWVDADGDPIPYVSGQGKPTLTEGQLDEAPADRVRAATVPVEAADCPILLISGDDDPVWPARRLSAVAADRLRESDHGYDVEHLTYDDVGHFLTPPYLPKASPVFGGSLAARGRADADTWPTALSYLRRGVEA